MSGRDIRAGEAAFLRLGLCLAFAASAAMPLLYFQNQNTKFLHGIAAARPDRLGADWTAHTVDGLPVFSALVRAVATWSHPGMFYGLELGLLAVMCLSLLELARLAAPAQARRPAFLLAAAGLIAALAHPSQEESLSGVAGQYMMGGYLQPSEFGILYLPAILLALRRHPAALILGAVPAAMHPAYIALSAICVALFLWDRWRAGAGIPVLPLAAALALLILPPLDLARRFAPTDPELFARANAILAFQRIPHHSDPAQWAGFTALRQLSLALLALVLAPRGLLRSLLAALLLMAVGGAGFVALSGNAEVALMAPWRASILIIPLAWAIVIGRLLGWLLARSGGPYLPTVLSLAMLALATWTAADGLAVKWRNTARTTQPDHLRFIRETHRPGDIYLTDPDQSGFRLNAMSAQFVSGKTHPYLDHEVLEWDRRLDLAERVFPRRAPLDCAALDEVLAHYEITHVLIRQGRLPAVPCPALTPLFDGESHAVLAVTPAR
ncbi:MAG: DUF6798 domain-containing protein [Tropicimonas sp.]|uniref:DUF6798 domain-containing protein n=1 Tax=Tropicimonas sp. TaxID=2067044 RepID=UPI003A85A1D4